LIIDRIYAGLPTPPDSRRLFLIPVSSDSSLLECPT
jgi:hypothetical protein